MEATIRNLDVNQKEAEQDRRNTLAFLDYFTFYNAGRTVDSPLGAIEEPFVINALKKGIKLDQIVFDWKKDPQVSQVPSVAQVEVEGKKQIQVTLNPALLKTIEDDLQRLMPQGVITVVENRTTFLRETLKRLKNRLSSSIEDKYQVVKTITQIYRLYLQD